MSTQPVSTTPTKRQALAAAARAHQTITNQTAKLETAIAQARAAGASWSEVAGRLNTTKQNAWEKFRGIEK